MPAQLYATLTDLVARFGETEITQIGNSASFGAPVLDAVRVNVALDDANAEVEGYLAPRYPTGLDPVPVLITRLTCDIARYRLYDDAAPEAVRERYQDAVRLLTSISAGRVSFGQPEAAPTHSQVALCERARPSLFGRRPNGGVR